MENDDTLTAAMQDYLEAILVLDREGAGARVKDIATSLGVKMPSVSSAITTLKRHALVEQRRYGVVQLTKAGRQVADAVYRRHEALVEFLTHILLLGPEEAETEACQMEHALSEVTLDRLVKLVELLRACPSGDACLSVLEGDGRSSH